MAEQIQFELVSPEALLMSRPVDMVVVPGVEGDFGAQARRVFENLAAVAAAAGGSLAQVARVTVYLTDLGRFAELNEIMARYFAAPYPARAAIGALRAGPGRRHR